MSKPLSQMSLEELWQLFPIILTPHQPCWSVWYEEEAEALTRVLPLNARISHIGSTAIRDIWAKPIVDILVEIPKETTFSDMKTVLNTVGYRCMSQSANRLSFNKGYTEQGFAERVFHLHLRRFGDNAECCFRDYLNAHPRIAHEYEQLKLSLWKEFEHDRDGYTDAKSAFVMQYTDASKK